MIKRPDKEDTIRIEAMTDAPRAEAAPEKRAFAPRRETPHHDKPRREARAPDRVDFAGGERPAKQHGKPYEKSHGKPHGEKPRGESAPAYDRKPDFKAKKRHQDKPAFAGNSRRDRGDAPKPSFGKKPNKKFRA